MNHNHKNKKLFQEKFQDFEPELDRDIWAGIEMGMKKRKVPFFSDYRRMAMAAAAVVLIFFVAGLMWERNQQINVPAGNETNLVKTEKNKKTETIKEVEKQVVMPEKQEIKQEVAAVKPAPKARKSETKPSDKGEKDLLENYSTAANLGEKNMQVADKQQNIVSQPNLNGIKEELEVEKIIPKPQIPEMKKIEAVAATKSMPVNDWKTIHVPAKSTKNKQGQIVENEVIAKVEPSLDNLNSLDLSHFNLNNALVFASHKMEKLANKPLNVYHLEDSKESHWTYIFKLKGFQIIRKVHRKKK